MSKNNLSSLTDEQLKLLTELTVSLSSEQIVWVSGYFSGLLVQQSLVSNKKTDEDASKAKPVFSYTPEAVVAKPDEEKEVTILYGSRTGNGEFVAKLASKMATEAGFKASLKSMQDYKTRDLKDEKNVLFIISTHGEGVPPFQAKEFYDFLHSKRAPRLDKLHFSVLALGDRSYLDFCKAGKDIDARLEELGAHRNFNRVDCDVEFRKAALDWVNNALRTFKGEEKMVEQVEAEIISTEGEVHDKHNPFNATVLDKTFLHGKGSDRQTLHVELSIEGSGLTYEPGDALGVYATNPPELVEKLLNQFYFDKHTEVKTESGKGTLYNLLLSQCELTSITPDVLIRYLELVPNDELKAITANAAELKTFLYGKDIIDLFGLYPAELTPEQLVSILRKLQPRLYSIASSPLAHPDEVHLTVGVVKYKSSNRDKTGLCSVFLSDRISNDEIASVFIEKNNNFRLPKDPSKAIIMVGAGTGIAPYRAFVEHRAETPGSGKNWLVFGNRYSESEFLYQLEWQRFIKDGQLKMDVAFSRDTDDKVYVQDRLLQNSKEVYAWLQEGAYFYICGDMKKMSTAVHQALLQIVSVEGNHSLAEAEHYLNDLQKQHRYQTDVY